MLDYQTYKDLGFKKIESQAEFDKVEADSELLVSNLTQNYYDFHDLKSDLNSDNSFLVYRAKQYQRAICLQCEFATELGASTPLGQQNTALTDVQIGRTHLQKTSNSVNSVTYAKSGVVLTAYNVLGRTGLLYRGVDHYW